jgi:hypothetical protein
MRAIAASATGLVLVSSVGVYAHGGGGGFNWGDWWGQDQGETSFEVDNENDVDLTNNTTQNAVTGNSVVTAGDNDDEDNNFGCFSFRNHCNNHEENNDVAVVLGDATTGAASNENETVASVVITNDSPCECLGSTSEGGDVTVEVDNDNDVTINNNTTQNAVSGDATVIGGSDGSATTGDASNYNSSTFAVTIGN